MPIIEVLVEMGGSGKSRDVVRRVGEKLSHKLTAADRARIESGFIRWKNRAYWSRKRMVNEGLLEPKENVPYGVWKLTAEGWRLSERVLGR